MNKEVRLNHYHYRQNYSATCGIACYLMALSIYNPKIKPSKKNEKHFFEKLKEKNGQVVTIESIIRDAVKRKLSLTIYSELDYNKISFKKPQAEKLRKDYLRLVNRLMAQNKLVNNQGIKLNLRLIKKLIDQGKVMLVNGTVNGYPHMRLVSGYTAKNELVVSDPQEIRKVLMSFKSFIKVSKPPLGMWAVAISK